MSLLQTMGGVLAAVFAVAVALWAAKRKGAAEASQAFNERAKADDQKRAHDLRVRVDAARLRPDDLKTGYRD